MALTSGSLASVSIHDLVHGCGDAPHFRRREVEPEMVAVCPPKVVMEDIRAEKDYNPFAWREDNNLPQPPSTGERVRDGLHLSLQLGKYLGDGRSGIVYEVTPIGAHGFTTMPDLVVKVARQTRCMSSAREAWFYNYLQCLQGVAIPRCFGWFELEIPLDSEWDIPAWRLYPPEDGSDDLIDGPAEFMDPFEEEVKRHKLVPHPSMRALARTRSRVCILLLERVGKSVIRTPSLETDLHALYREFTLLSIDLAKDIKYSNVLRAPSHPSYPTLASPLTQITHKYRVIDLELALLTYRAEEDIAGAIEDYVELIIVDTPATPRRKPRRIPAKRL